MDRKISPLLRKLKYNKPNTRILLLLSDYNHENSQVEETFSTVKIIKYTSIIIYIIIIELLYESSLVCTHTTKYLIEEHHQAVMPI
jgi:hypothetical protein